MTKEHILRRQVVEVGRRMYQKGLVVATEGNISVRLAPQRVLMTPTGAWKGFLNPADLVVVDLNGRARPGPAQAGGPRPSMEFPMHRGIYRVRADVRAIVHAHPPAATGFAVAGIPLDQPILAEAVLVLGPVPVVPYATPATDALPEAIAPYAAKHQALLLGNHGAVTMGRDLWEAYARMEILEHLALIQLTTRLLGRADSIPPAEIQKLHALLGKPHR
jgi:L-fuculose-phosphate aldolase